MTRVLAVLCFGVVALVGCGSGSDDTEGDGTAASGDAGAATIEATDGSFSLEVPDGWSSQDQFLQGPVVVAAQGQDEVDQLLVSAFPQPGGAEDQAIFTATGLADSGITCKRLEDSTAFGDARLVFDCPQDADGSTVRRLLLPVEHDGKSILVFLQTSGETLDDTAAVVRPIVESVAWK
ncbi:MAG: hypothetical protein JWN22_3613 [Nocardioides sp.]|jgi:hypothetical protein|nr:hypothetical protein [Nocardioides sp.]